MFVIHLKADNASSSSSSSTSTSTFVERRTEHTTTTHHHYDLPPAMDPVQGRPEPSPPLVKVNTLLKLHTNWMCQDNVDLERSPFSNVYRSTMDWWRLSEENEEKTNNFLFIFLQKQFVFLILQWSTMKPKSQKIFFKFWKIINNCRQRSSRRRRSTLRTRSSTDLPLEFPRNYCNRSNNGETMSYEFLYSARFITRPYAINLNSSLHWNDRRFSLITIHW